MNFFRTKGHVCSYRHAFSLDNFIRRLIQPPKKIVGPYIRSGFKILDLGCGPGFFTIPMAELAGETGVVCAVDLQEEMLDIIAGKLFDTPLAHRVHVHQCMAHTLDLESILQVDFILAYYMVHETQNQQQFFKETRKALKTGGKMLIVEPPFHVSRKKFKQMVAIAQRTGFKVIDRPKGKGGMAVLLA